MNDFALIMKHGDKITGKVITASAFSLSRLKEGMKQTARKFTERCFLFAELMFEEFRVNYIDHLFHSRDLVSYISCLQNLKGA